MKFSLNSANVHILFSWRNQNFSMEHKKTKLFSLIYLKMRCSKLLAMRIKTHLENNWFIINRLIHICKFTNAVISKEMQLTTWRRIQKLNKSVNSLEEMSLSSKQAFRRYFFQGTVQVTVPLSKFRNCSFFRSFFPGTVTFHVPFSVPFHQKQNQPLDQQVTAGFCIFWH